MKYESEIIKIQKWIRGCLLRIKRLPLIMYKIQKYLKSNIFVFSSQNKDGRINSFIDENDVIKSLIKNFGVKIKKPNGLRCWYDILAFDYMYGWLPINIKTTTTKTSDNVGNLTMCVYAYTDEKIDIHSDKACNNGKMSDILFKKIKDKRYNKYDKKDYYFLVLNKTNNKDIIINSVKGLSILTPNINNLPFQICWNKNRAFNYKHIEKNIKMFIECIQKPKPSWQETFLSNIRTI